VFLHCPFLLPEKVKIATFFATSIKKNRISN
jgi:hypothetical protein